LSIGGLGDPLWFADGRWRFRVVVDGGDRLMLRAHCGRKRDLSAGLRRRSVCLDGGKNRLLSAGSQDRLAGLVGGSQRLVCADRRKNTLGWAAGDGCCRQVWKNYLRAALVGWVCRLSPAGC
jgi:hypothetical protein